MTIRALGRSSGITVAALVALGVLLTGGFALGASKYLGGFGWPVVVALVAAAVAVPIAFLLPVHWLPAIALAAFTIIPNRITPSGYTLRIPLWGFIIAVWVLRRLIARGPALGAREQASWRSLVLGWRILAYASAAAFVIWAGVSVLRSDHLTTGVSWTGSIVICVLLPLLVLDARREAALLRSTWIIGGGIIGVYAVLELLLQSSPLYGTLYEVLGVGDVQHWVLQRAEGSFGHPLLAGTYFATAATLGIVQWFGNHRTRDLMLGGIAAAGVVATVSRSAMLAIAVALAFAIVAWIVSHPDSRIGKPVVFAFVGLIAAVAVLNSTPVQARSESLESLRSAGARDTGFGVALRAAQFTDFLGSGPGTSGVTGRLFDPVTIENSALQLLISLGIPGLVLFVLFLAGVGLTALRVRDIAAASALLAFGVSIVGYNAIDAVRPVHLLLGFLVIICMSPLPSGTHPPLVAGEAASSAARPGNKVGRQRLARTAT